MGGLLFVYPFVIIGKIAYGIPNSLNHDYQNWYNQLLWGLILENWLWGLWDYWLLGIHWTVGIPKSPSRKDFLHFFCYLSGWHLVKRRTSAGRLRDVPNPGGVQGCLKEGLLFGDIGYVFVGHKHQNVFHFPLFILIAWIASETKITPQTSQIVDFFVQAGKKSRKKQWPEPSKNSTRIRIPLTVRTTQRGPTKVWGGWSVDQGPGWFEVGQWFIPRDSFGS